MSNKYNKYSPSSYLSGQFKQNFDEGMFEYPRPDICKNSLQFKVRLDSKKAR